MTPAEEEAYVRARWIRVTNHGAYIVIRNVFRFCSESFIDWHAAYLFTVQREAEIADVKEEIELLESLSITDYRRGIAILAREQAALAELKKGWK
jgi:phage terminase Nu1 subunit (DNA packaging protein)